MSNNSDLSTLATQLDRYFDGLVKDGEVTFEPPSVDEDNTVEIGYTFNPRDDADALPGAFERTCLNIVRQYVSPTTEVRVARKEAEVAAPVAAKPAA